MSSLPSAPTDVQLTAIGARAMRVQWAHNGEFGGSSLAAGFQITILRTMSGRESLVRRVDVNNIQTRSQVISALEPYSYFSSEGVMFTVQVMAVSGSDVVSSISQTISLPCEQ